MSGALIQGGVRNGEADRAGHRQAGYRHPPRQGAGAREIFGALGKCAAILVASGALLLSAAGTAAATDQFLVLRSPSFGGTNTTPFQYEQFDKTLRDQRDAAAKSAATASGAAGAAPDQNQQFANAIISQLNSLVARDIALKIANSKAGDAGTIASGNVSITFINSDGQLNVVITTPTGSTNLSVPTGE